MIAEQKKSGLGALALSLIAALSLSACASSMDGEVADPIEGVNRSIFKFNDVVDEAVLKPVAKGYRAAVPQTARTGVRNFLHNLKSPTIIANDILQGNFKGACDDTTRMMANTLLGFGGLVDVADMGGVKYREEDFGQTLGHWGMGHGFYLVLPLMGPSSGRDTAGLLVDSYVDPVRLWLTNTDNEEWYYGKVALAAVDKREELLDVLEDLKKNSIDYYAATRSAYIQRREALVNDANADGGAMPDMP
jgi:phospholipid-binding lipoprotein MlaA